MEKEMKRNSDLLYIDHIVRWSLHYGPTVPAHTVCTLKENKQTEPVIRFHFIKEIYFAEMLLLYFTEDDTNRQSQCQSSEGFLIGKTWGSKLNLWWWVRTDKQLFVQSKDRWVRYTPVCSFCRHRWLTIAWIFFLLFFPLIYSLFLLFYPVSLKTRQLVKRYSWMKASKVRYRSCVHCTSTPKPC